MSKPDATQIASAYIMLIGIVCAALRINTYLSIIIFIIGVSWAIGAVNMHKTAIRYSIFALIPIIALFVHIPLSKSLPDLIQLAIIFGFWIIVLLLSAYLLLARKTSTEQHTHI